MPFIEQFIAASNAVPAATAVAAVSVALLVLLYAASTLAFAARWMRVALGTRSVPTAPENNWLLGHILPLARNCAWEKMYDWLVAHPGDLVKFRIGHRTGVLVGDPAGLKRIFQTRYKLYEKDLDFSYKPFLSILGSGLVTANGAHWQRQRILMAPALRVDMLDAILPIARRAADRLADKLQALCDAAATPMQRPSAAASTEEANLNDVNVKSNDSPATVTLDIEEEFRLLTLQVIGEAILSLPPEECDRVFPALYLPVMEESNRRVLAPWRYCYPTTVLQYNSRVRQLNTYIIGIIRERRAARAARVQEGSGTPVPPRDILDRILTSVEERGEKWGPAVERQLCYEIKTFLLAGHETSAAMLTWTFYELARNQSALRKVQREADAHLGPVVPVSTRNAAAKEGSEEPKGEKVNQDGEMSAAAAAPVRAEVEKMEWALACLKESLRKYSVVPVVTRNLVAEDELCGHKLPAGAWVICHLQRVHHLYKDPLTWQPQRFMPGDEYDRFPEDIRPYMFVPFIQGPRNCLGQYFALLEARVVLGALCQRFDFEPVDPERQGLTHPTVIPIGPVNGMEMKINPRSGGVR